MNEWLVYYIPGDPISDFKVHNKEAVGWHLYAQRKMCEFYVDKPLEGPCEIELDFCFVKAKSNKLTTHTTKPCVSNLIKFIEDAANGIVFVDDKQIVSITARKFYGPNAYTEMRIREHHG